MNKWEVISALHKEEEGLPKYARRPDRVLEMLEQANAINTQELTDKDATKYYARHKAAMRKENPQ